MPRKGGYKGNYLVQQIIHIVGGEIYRHHQIEDRYNTLGEIKTLIGLLESINSAATKRELLEKHPRSDIVARIKTCCILNPQFGEYCIKLFDKFLGGVRAPLLQ